MIRTAPSSAPPTLPPTTSPPAADPAAYDRFSSNGTVHWPFYRNETERQRDQNGDLFFCRPGAT